MHFKLWSEQNEEAKSLFKPNLGLRSWDDLSQIDKGVIWEHMRQHFFDKTPGLGSTTYSGHSEARYMFYGHEYILKNTIINTISALIGRHKSLNLAPKFLRYPSENNACEEFYSIFIKRPGDVVLELLSTYYQQLFSFLYNNRKTSNAQSPTESLEDYEGTIAGYTQGNVNPFIEDLNDISDQFRLNITLTPQGFLPKQDSKIMENIVIPAMDCLAGAKWQKVNESLRDALHEFEKNTNLGYSQCVTSTVSAIQAFLQITIHGDIGTGNISQLITEAQKRNLIPSDAFTKTVFRNIESILAIERQSTGTAHPKLEYATQKNAKLLLNLAMVFFQHCLV